MENPDARRALTLNEAIERLGRWPRIGDHEIVLDKQGVGHIVVITSVDEMQLSPGFVFMCVCGATSMLDRADVLRIAPTVTCLTCATWHPH